MCEIGMKLVDSNKFMSAVLQTKGACKIYLMFTKKLKRSDI